VKALVRKSSFTFFSRLLSLLPSAHVQASLFLMYELHDLLGHLL
jgi:hypothetical protein